MLEQELVKQINSLQKQVDGLIKPEVGRWKDWIPTVTQLGAVAVTVIYARYIIVVDTVIIQALLAITAGGTIGNAIVIGGVPAVIAPANPTGAYSIIGAGFMHDASPGVHYHGALMAAGASDFRIITNLSNSYLGIDPAVALANGDTLSFIASYER